MGGLDRLAPPFRMRAWLLLYAYMIAAGVEAVHASCRVPTSGPTSPLFDTTIHGVDYDKACDLVDAVESVNAPES